MIFMEGIMFFFALGKNPIKEYERKCRQRNDAENIAQDWRNVGNDIRTAYERYGEQIKKAAVTTGHTDK